MESSQRNNLASLNVAEILKHLSEGDGKRNPQHSDSLYGKVCEKLNIVNNNSHRLFLHKISQFSACSEIPNCPVQYLLQKMYDSSSPFRSDNYTHKTSVWGEVVNSLHIQNSKESRRMVYTICTAFTDLTDQAVQESTQTPSSLKANKAVRNKLRRKEYRTLDVNKRKSNVRQKESNLPTSTNSSTISEQLAEQFKVLVNVFPTDPCGVCSKLCYPSLLKNIRIGPLLQADIIRVTGFRPADIYRSCTRCISQMSKGKIPQQSLWNKMTLPKIPNEISVLSPTEIRLISQVRAYIKVYVLNSGRGQKACQGMAIHFPLQVEEISNSLPLNCNQSDVVLISENFDDDRARKITEVRPAVLFNALQWLKRNNGLYANVNVRDSFDSDITRSSSIRLVPTALPLPSFENNAEGVGYHLIDDQVQILRASFSQGHPMFEDSRGRQCTAMCAVFIAYSFHDSPLTWTRSVVDEVVLYGDRLYKNRNTGEDMEYLNADDICGVLEIHQSVEINLSICGMEILPLLQGVCRKNNRVRDLQEKLLMAINTNFLYFLVTVNLFTVAFVVHEDFVYLFDSHQRGPKGFVARSRGTAYVMKMPKSHAAEKLSHMIVRNCISSNPTETAFTITPLRVEYFSDTTEHPTGCAVSQSSLVSPARKSRKIDEDTDQDSESSGEEPEDVESLIRQFDGRNEVDCVIAENHFVEPNVESILNGSVTEINRMKKSPISDRERHLDVLAFPHLFPDGKNGLDENRPIKITPLDYFQQRIMCGDKRFRGASEYVFYGLSVNDRWRIKQTVNVVASMKPQQNIDKPEELLQQIGVESPQIIQEKIRGSPAYWRRYRSHVFAMVKTLGTPQFFFTFSFDDLNSLDAVNAMLKAENGKSAGTDDPTSIPYEERRQLLNDHPVTAARHFSMRVLKLLKFMKDHSTDIFGTQLKDYTLRIEFQTRGSPHAHSMLWFEDAPDWKSPEGIEFLERNVTCSLEGPNRELALKYQSHRHSKTCYKRENSHCRFGFPKGPVEDTEFYDDDDILRHKGKFCALKRKSEEAMVNNYHPILLGVLKCNMDIQPITDASGVVYYATKYMSKSEPVEMRDSVREAITRIKNSNVPIQQKMLRISYALMSKREISIQEAAMRLCHLPLRYSSRAVKFISTFSKDKRLRMLDKESLMQGEVKFCDNIIERYINRPDTLAHICLFEFAAHFTIKRSNPAHSKVTSNEEDDLIEFEEDNLREDELENYELVLKNNKGRIKQRKKPFVIDYYRFDPIENRQEYYYSLLLLYLPFTNENFCDEESPQSVFHSRFNELRTHADDPIINIELAHEIESALVRLANFSEEQLEDIQMDQSITADYEEDMPQHDSNEYFPVHGIRTVDKLKNMLQKFTQKQLEVFNKIKTSIENGDYKDPEKALRIWVTGGAGTGKSYVLKALKIYIQNKLSQDSLIVAAPSGRAAHLVKGITCHRAFSLPIEHETVGSSTIGPRKLAELRQIYKNVSHIIIDEMSMLSYENLRIIHQRLCEIFESEELFGGKSIILFGDILQLPPVKGHFIFQQPEKFSAEENYWRCFTCEELTVNKRQNIDDPLLDVCNNLRVGEITNDDLIKLEERILDPRKPNYEEMKTEFKDAIRLYPTVKKCESYNEAMMTALERTGRKTFVVKAFDTFADGSNFGKPVPEKMTPKNINKTAGIPSQMKLCIGAKVMLRRNISTDKGLCNGSVGDILEISWPINDKEQVNPGELPSRVKIKFDHIEEPQWISCTSAEFYHRKQRISRRMIPLSLAWAFTYHKAQGMSLKKCVIDLGSKLFAKGMAYVALSRVCSLKGLAIEGNFNASALLSTSKYTPASVHALDELERLKGRIIVPRK